jgi:hypothetical protein
VTDQQSLVAVFTHSGSLLTAIKVMEEAGHAAHTVYSPIPLPEADKMLKAGRSTISRIALVGAIVTALGFIGTAVYAHLSFSIITGGKPVLPWVPWVVVCFEGIILGAVIFSVCAWVLKGRLPTMKSREGYDPRFSQDHFGLHVTCPDQTVEDLTKLLLDAGAKEVHRVEG